MSTVLIVEDEQFLRSSMASGLGKLPDVSILTAGTVEDALRLVDFSPPDLVLSDLDLPDRTGVELYNELQLRGLGAPVVFISAHLSHFESALPHGTAVEAHQKPVPLEELRSIVVRNLRGDTSEDEGDPFSLDEYLQIAAMGRHSVVIDVAGSGAVPAGQIVVAGGEIWAAHDADGEGEPAFRRLVRHWIAHQPKVRCRKLRDEPGERNLASGQGQSLMLDVVRSYDEEVRRGPRVEPVPRQTVCEDSFAHLLSDPPRASSPVRVGASLDDAGAAPSGRFEELMDAGIETLLHKQFDAAYRHFVEAAAIRPDDSRVRANIARLREMGFGAEEAPQMEEIG